MVRIWIRKFRKKYSSDKISHCLNMLSWINRLNILKQSNFTNILSILILLWQYTYQFIPSIITVLFFKFTPIAVDQLSMLLAKG